MSRRMLDLPVPLAPARRTSVPEGASKVSPLKSNRSPRSSSSASAFKLRASLVWVMGFKLLSNWKARGAPPFAAHFGR